MLSWEEKRHVAALLNLQGSSQKMNQDVLQDQAGLAAVK
jgi:hypothetical protein